MISIKSDTEIEIIRKAGKILAGAFQTAEPLMKPGISAKEIDNAVEEYIVNQGAVAAFKNYPNSQGGKPFPASICLSIEDEVVHGIPGGRILKEGTIVSLDIGVKYQGYYADSARSYAIGEIDGNRKKLLEVTKHCLDLAIAEAKSGQRLSNIGHAVSTYAEANKFGVVRDLVGHGIGKQLHEEPQIPNYGPPNRGPIMRKNMVFAIEPMINMGTWEVDMVGDWQIVTKDRKPSAHFEHTILITDGDAEVLTR